MFINFFKMAKRNKHYIYVWVRYKKNGIFLKTNGIILKDKMPPTVLRPMQ